MRDKQMSFSRGQVRMDETVNEVLDLCQHVIDNGGNHIVQECVGLENATMERVPRIETDQHRTPCT